MLEKDDILKENYLVKKRQASRDEKKYRGDKNRLFIVAVLLCIILLASLYLMSSRSKVYRVSVSGNVYLDDDYYRGRNMVLGNIELRIPVQKMFSLVFFYDITHELKSFIHTFYICRSRGSSIVNQWFFNNSNISIWRSF